MVLDVIQKGDTSSLSKHNELLVQKLYDDVEDTETQAFHKQQDKAVVKYENATEDPNIQDTEEYVEESLSLVDKEIELIKKALEKHGGKRKSAAENLGISERTLYRKIKEYHINL